MLIGELFNIEDPRLFLGDSQSSVKNAGNAGPCLTSALKSIGEEENRLTAVEEPAARLSVNDTLNYSSSVSSSDSLP